MDSPLVPRDSFEDEGQKLKACEENLRRYHQLALAGRLVGASMHEVNNRLAALTNLIFLAKTLAQSLLQVIEYLDEADLQLRSLGEVTSRSLAFVRLDTEPKRSTWWRCYVGAAPSRATDCKEEDQRPEAIFRSGVSSALSGSTSCDRDLKLLSTDAYSHARAELKASNSTRPLNSSHC